AGPRSDVTNLIGLSSGWAISRSAQDKELAWEFVKFASSPETNARSIVERHSLPTYVQNVEIAAETLGERAGVSNLFLVFEALLTTGKAYNPLVDLSVSSEFTERLVVALRGEEPLESVLLSAHSVIQNRLAEILAN